MGQDNKSNKERSLLLALLLFVGAGVLLFMSIETPEKQASSGNGPSARERVRGADWEKQVNRHLFKTNERMAMEREKMQLENSKNAPRMYEVKAQSAYKQENSLDLSTDRRGYEIADDLGRGVRNNEAARSPHEIVQGELFNEQQTEEYTKAYKEEYARQFVENARQGGYDVKLSEDFRVLSVKPIRRPSGQGQVDPIYNSIDSSNQ